MKALYEAFIRSILAFYVSLQQGTRRRLASERGDTNFISILIILGVVILLAGVFIGFKDYIVKQVKEIVEGFTIDTSK